MEQNYGTVAEYSIIARKTRHTSLVVVVSLVAARSATDGHFASGSIGGSITLAGPGHRLLDGLGGRVRLLEIWVELRIVT
jgi:hypothetical protein